MLDSSQQDREQRLLEDNSNGDDESPNIAVRRRRRPGILDRVLADVSNDHRPYPVPPALDHEATISETTEEPSIRRFTWSSLIPPFSSTLITFPQQLPSTHDIATGCTVGLMLVPQSMSYARLAGLPVQYGLYAATTSAYAYAATASSHSRLAVGPVAMVSLLLQSGLAGIVTNDDGNDNLYQQLAIQTAGAVGICYLLLGWARAGASVVRWFSHAVVAGFTTAAAIIIAVAQTKYIVGYSVAPSDRLLPNLWQLWTGRSNVQWGTVGMGVMGTLFLVTTKHVSTTFRKLRWIKAVGPLVLTVTALVLTWAFQLHHKGIAVVGEIPSGLPNFTLHKWWSSTSHLVDLLPTIIGIVAVGFMESIAIAKQLATKLHYELDSSQELVSLGCANLAAGMFQGYPVAGSFSRSAINSDAGSSLSGVITATLVGSALLLLTVVFEMLPLNVLAAIVISGVLGIMDFREAVHLWKKDRKETFCWAVAFLGTLLLGVEAGLGLAIGVSLVLVVLDMTRPHITILGRLQGTSHYVDHMQYVTETERYESVLVLRIEAPMFFANVDMVWEKVKALRVESPEPVRSIVFDMSAVPFLDGSAVESFRHSAVSFQNDSIQVLYASLSQRILDKFSRRGDGNSPDPTTLFTTVHDAVVHSLQVLEEEDFILDQEVSPVGEDEEPSYGTMISRRSRNIC